MVCKVPKCLCPSSVLCGQDAGCTPSFTEGDINACLIVILLLPISVSWIVSGSERDQPVDTVTSSILYADDITGDVMNKQFHIWEPTAKNG